MSLDQVFPATREVAVAGRTVVVAPLRMGQLAQVLPLLGQLQPAIERHVRLGAAADGSPLALIAWGPLLAEAGAAVLELTRLAAGLTRDDWSDLLPDDALRLAAAVVEVNGDFFARRVAPALTEATRAVRALSTGPAPSTPSSAPATP